MPKPLSSLVSFLTLFFLLLSAQQAFAQSTYLSVGSAKTKKAALAITDTGTAEGAAVYDASIKKIIESDLQFIEFFKLLPENTFPLHTFSALTDLRQSEWMKIGADFLTFSTLKLDAGKNLLYELHVINISGSNEVLAKRYTAPNTDLKILAHSIANDIVFAITGIKGIFHTKIVFSCNKNNKNEIYTMNFDGSEAKPITHLQSIAMAPAWSPDGNKIAFSVFNKHTDNTKNIDLFELNLKNAKLQPLSNKKGINSGANYHPNGKQMAITLSYHGNPDIFLLDLSTKQATPMTHSIGFDVDPSFSPDGSQIAFVSSRAGRPMIYVAPTANPNQAKRLTFAGQFNATPTWSPDGKKITFAGWIDGHFDLFSMSIDGAKIDRLTEKEGNNEDPSYSPDGNFLVFSSNRVKENNHWISGKEKNVWVMSIDETIVKRLTFGMGNCTAPKWSPFLN